MTLIRASTVLTRRLTILDGILSAAIDGKSRGGSGATAAAAATALFTTTAETALWSPRQRRRAMELALREYDGLADYVPTIVDHLGAIVVVDGADNTEDDENEKDDEYFYSNAVLASVLPKITTIFVDFANFDDLRLCAFSNNDNAKNHEKILLAQHSLLHSQIDLLYLLTKGLSQLDVLNSKQYDDHDKAVLASCVKIVSSILNYNGANEPIVVGK